MGRRDLLDDDPRDEEEAEEEAEEEREALSSKRYGEMGDDPYAGITDAFGSGT